MLKERLKDMDLKITELCEYMDVSRPTMYKFIEYYETGEHKLINDKILKLFNYISEHELAGKKNVVNYILTDLSDLDLVNENKEETNIVKLFKSIVLDNQDSKKAQFLISCITTDYYDDVISFLEEVKPLLTKDDLDETELKMLAIYTQFLAKIKGGRK